MKPLLRQLPELAGVVLLIAATVYWSTTGRESLLVMVSAVMLIALGALAAPAGHDFDKDIR
jgi:hypothetical protein